MRYFLGTRSESAPPSRETIAIGAAKETIAQVRAEGEPDSRRKTSQLWVIICMFIAVKDAKEPSQIQRKSASWSISAMGDWRNLAASGERGRAAAGACAGAVMVVCAKEGIP